MGNAVKVRQLPLCPFKPRAREQIPYLFSYTLFATGSVSDILRSMTLMRGLSNALPDFPDLDESPADRVDRLVARKRRMAELEEARQMIREAVKDDAIKARLDALPKLLGPEPETGEEWANRGMRALELATIADLGFHPSAAAALEAACMKRAAVMEPGKFGAKVQIPTGADGNPVAVIAIRFVDAATPEREINPVAIQNPKA